MIKALAMALSTVWRGVTLVSDTRRLTSVAPPYLVERFMPPTPAVEVICFIHAAI